jgi:hypothetical protein
MSRKELRHRLANISFLTFRTDRAEAHYDGRSRKEGRQIRRAHLVYCVAPSILYLNTLMQIPYISTPQHERLLSEITT